MPEELSRTTKRKKVLLPHGDFVYIPVITKISFIDPFQQYQEWEYSIDNSTESSRIVRVDQVPQSSGGEATGGAIWVERIEKWPHIDAFDRYQETQMQFDNLTGNDAIPPHFRTHLKTHVVRYKNQDDDNIWVDSELIDSFSVIDPLAQYQEKIFTLNNPQNDDDAQADPNDPDITNGDGSGEGTAENPVRTDPFQNIVNFGSTSTSVSAIEYFLWRYPIPDAPPRWVPVEPDTGSTGFTGQTFSQMQRAWIQEKIDAGEADPIGGGWRGDRLLRSTLLTDAANGSNIGSDNPASIYFNVTIGGFGSLASDYFHFYDSLFITPQPPINPAPHGTWVYGWCSGSYITDDVTTA